MAVDSRSVKNCIQVLLVPRGMPGNAQGSDSTLPLSSPGLWCCVPCSCWLWLGILLSLPCVWAPGLALGLVRCEAEEQGVHFSPVAVTVSARASSSTLPLQQLGVAGTERGHLSC